MSDARKRRRRERWSYCSRGRCMMMMMLCCRRSYVVMPKWDCMCAETYGTKLRTYKAKFGNWEQKDPRVAAAAEPKLCLR